MRDMTRREALQRGGIVAGGLALGGTVLSRRTTADHGETGGTMLVADVEGPESVPLLGEPFVVSGVLPDPIVFPASCFASESEVKTYTDFLIEYVNVDDGLLAAVRQNKKHFDLTGETEYVFTSIQECGDLDAPATVWKASFRPA